MMDMIEGFVRNLSEGNLLVAVIVGIPLTVALFRLLYSLITEIKERKNNDLKGALEINGLSEDVRFVIHESLNRTYFYRATGITSDHYIRSKIRQFLETTKGEITLFGIKRVSEYIQIEDEKLVIKYDRFDVFNYYWQMIFSVVLAITCLIAIALVIAAWGLDKEGTILLAIEAPCLLILGLHSLWKASNFYIARKIIKPAFERFESGEAIRVIGGAEESQTDSNKPNMKIVG
ncbi:hypothetical protein [Amphritea pacifica]|uniref:DUF4282 domain-containing protein n=1 Tax=Amphritea pacifica TaxID=2811233 RepID=A0ABS2W402_9GAMM|nr:hypothetical protein [Amphritea pacifica]MBN0986444.1 hypothetical protein [Amphritea pacifica]